MQNNKEMTNAALTDRQFWSEYWKTHPIVKVSRHVFFLDLVKDLNGKGKRFIELGGFPGYHCVFFHKYLGYDVSLLDYYINREIIARVEEINGLRSGTIKVIEADVFNLHSSEKYDLVFSAGLVEHFQDIPLIIQRHTELTSDEGTVLILIPNFLGINGMVQRLFDKENLKKHNLECMKLEKLKQILSAYKNSFDEIQIFYYGKPMIWLEQKGKNFLPRLIKLISLFIGLLPFRGKWFSPYICIRMDKQKPLQ